MEDLYRMKWVKMPTAMQGYLNSPKLQKEHGSYSNYAYDCYKVNKNSWKNGALVYVENIGAKKGKKPRGFLGTDSHNKRKDDIKSIAYIDTKIKNKTCNKYEEKINNIQFYNVTKLKPKNNRKTKNYRRVKTTCPNCLSTLKLNEVGVWECAGDRLRLWETEFLKYNKLSDEQKVKYLINFAHPSLFLDLFDKWNYLENGRRVRFECEYSNKLFNPISRFRTTILDPILVKRIERNLGRTLTVQEKDGDSEIWREGNTYFADYRKGRIKVRIPHVVYPDGIL